MSEVIVKDKKLIAGVRGVNRTLTAAGNAGIERRETIEEIGPYKGVDQSNRFKLYQQLSVMSPHIFIPMLKMSLTIIKGIRFVSKTPAKVEEYETWAEAIGFRNKIQTLSLLLCRDGTYVATITNTSPELFDFEPALMQNVSILPVGYNPDAGSSLVLTPPVESFIVNEGIQDAETPYKRDQIIYGTLFPRTGVVKDTKNRETYGLYGQSMLDSIEDTLYKYLKVISGYSGYIHRYGYGRYAIIYEALEEFIREGDIDSAIDALDKLAEEHATIEENEDIVGAGFKIQELNTGGSNPNVTQWKESLEKDIQIGLLQAPLTMGRGEGTTFASGYISEEDRMIALEGIQNLVKDIVNNEIIRRKEGVQPGQPLDIRVEFEELSKPKVETKDLIDACDKGYISEEELRNRLGFSAAKPEGGTFRTIIVETPIQNAQNQPNPNKNGQKPTEDKQVDKKPINNTGNNQ